MTYKDTLHSAIHCIILQDSAYTKLAKSKEATKHGFFTILLSGILPAFSIVLVLGLVFLAVSEGKYLEKALFGGVAAMVIAGFVALVGFFIGYSIMHGLAKLFGGKATGAQYFRVMSNMMVLQWLLAVPLVWSIVGMFTGAWLVVLNIKTLKIVHKLSWGKAITIGLVPVMIGAVIVFVYYAVLLSMMATNPEMFLN